MSKTLKTRPLHVRMLDKRDHKVGVREAHDHREGPCDLPDREEFLKSDEALHTRCTYRYEYVGAGLHACPLCSDHDGRHRKTKKRRREDKMESVNQILEN